MYLPIYDEARIAAPSSTHSLGRSRLLAAEENKEPSPASISRALLPCSCSGERACWRLRRCRHPTAMVRRLRS